MQPIFPEYIKFLADKGCDVNWFKDRTFWLDHNMVKAFVAGGQNLVPLYKIVVKDDLSVTLSKHKQNISGLEFESWDETIQRLMPRLNELEIKSVAMLKEHCENQGRRIINTNSTGKDSMVVTHLAKKAGLNFETYFNVTTLDVAESNRMAKSNGFNHIFPDPQYGGFYKYIQRYDGGATK